jgi:4-hydroxy-3-polyprenylbenzoate decarboxylase
VTAYASLAECVADLEQSEQLVRIRCEIDPALEAGAIQRRVFAAGGPALLFERLRGTSFPALANLFGTRARAEFLFRNNLDGVRALVDARVDVAKLLRAPGRARHLPGAAMHALPRVFRSGAVLAHETRIGALPQIVSWPGDGGPFITLPQVYTEDPDRPSLMTSNLGMYRVQLAGNDYVPDREVGLHYQIHRGIGVHHAAAIRRGERLSVSVFVGGPPAMTLAAVMPLPEGLPELAFAGALGGRAIRMVRMSNGTHVHADADFCIRGTVEPTETKPEGPFGDHLGYYAKQHRFPVLRVESVTHREGAIWPFTTVGRPPQEDTIFGEMIHAITAPLVPEVLPGVRGVHAVDAAGVHPLLLAVGSERYVPYEASTEPLEILTQANAILGQGQMSLAKYLFIAAGDGGGGPSLGDVGAFLAHVLERFEPARDLHFHVRTTIDTLDYSGTALNRGSKLVVAAAGPKRRVLGRSVPRDLALPPGAGEARVALPGVLVVRVPAPTGDSSRGLRLFCEALEKLPGATDTLREFPLIVLVDDAEFASRTLANFLWVTFTRSNPAVDVDGIGAFTEHKAWACRGPLVIDARTKPHHAPPLEEDPAVVKRIEALAANGGPLAGLF